MKKENKEQFAIVTILKYVYRFSYEKKKWLFAYSFMFICVNVIGQMDILLGGYIFNYIQKNGVTVETFHYILFLILIIFVIDICGWTLHGPARIIEQRMAFFVSNNFRDFLYKNTLELPLSYHNSEHSGQIISKINKGRESIESFTSGGFMLIRSIFTAVAVFVALTINDYRFALVGVVLMIITYIIIGFFENKINPLRDNLNKSDNVLSEIIFDTISNITTIKMLSLSRLVRKSLDEETKTKYVSFKKKVVLNEIKWYVPSFFGSLFIVGVLLFYVYSMYITGSVVMIGSLYILYGFLTRLKEVLYDFAWMISDIQEQNRNILNSELISKHFNEIDKDDFPQCKNIKSIEITNLSFSYNENYTLEAEKLILEKGKKYAFVGESGCGKTTMLKILASLIKVDHYTCRINTQNAKIESLKNVSMLIPQEPELFSNTVRENITLGIPFEQKEIDEILGLVNMTETIANLPEGIESKIFEKGVNLSGGQKQRLALARGLIFAKDKEIVLLDEPTSSVDQISEMNIYTAIFKKFNDKIIISSVHKLALLPLFDYVVYFEQGKIVRVVDTQSFEFIKE